MPKHRLVIHLAERRESLGVHLQRSLDAFEGTLTARPLGAGLLGVGLAVAVVLGGLAAFAAVWALLVGVIH